MVHRILIGGEGVNEGRGQGAKAMALDLLRNGAIAAAWDLGPGGFQNCARVLSLRDVNTPPEQAAFDAMLDQKAQDFGVIRRADVGAFLSVVGTLIELPR